MVLQDVVMGSLRKLKEKSGNRIYANGRGNKSLREQKEMEGDSFEKY